MAFGRLVLCSVLSIFFLSTVDGRKEPPSWQEKSYAVNGYLQLPYAEIKEPFAAHYDAKNRKSRIDYYDTVKTIQIGANDENNYGVSYKIAPMTTYKVLNKNTCFQISGTKDAPIAPQSVLPDLTNYTFMGTEMKNGLSCDKWQYTYYYEKSQKKNVNTMWAHNAGGNKYNPVFYEMMGYDNIFGSHYDKYYVSYENFDDHGEIPASVFNISIIAKELTCGGFPGPGSEKEGHILFNPMKEYINNYDEHVDHLFNIFKKKHGKKYSHPHEHEEKKHIFRQNLRYIHSMNRQGLTFNLAVNHFADRIKSDLKFLRGKLYTPGSNGALPYDKKRYETVKDLPKDFDWRIPGAVTPVKDQSICGSCWSFGTTGTIEGAHFLKTGRLVSLSQQVLVDCSWGEGNNACDGGEDYRAYRWIIKNNGIPTSDSYGAYKGTDGKCHSKSPGLEIGAKIKNYVNVTAYDVEALKKSLVSQGPISIGIDASHRSLSFYSHGVYSDPKCGNKPEDLDHAVLLVGYGTLDGKDYWLIKNSWSTYWGNDGYFLMDQAKNMCGVTTSPTFVIVD
ncbi:DgyrCDS6668 [Dimorphilus gyrociliatus]|uniref:DgyrCDS6668 n=1 Tax=Dimorphilus gyrociliatus TaxID=2664684 RepID=A0A7I8VRF1_9ANNE|nr:DgyrCDS6668 [Dimorphilus gyrociliatus]